MSAADHAKVLAKQYPWLDVTMVQGLAGLIEGKVLSLGQVRLMAAQAEYLTQSPTRERIFHSLSNLYVAGMLVGRAAAPDAPASAPSVN